MNSDGAEERDSATTVEKHQGRVERRTLTASTGLNVFLRQTLGWSSICQVFRVVRGCL